MVPRDVVHGVVLPVPVVLPGHHVVDADARHYEHNRDDDDGQHRRVVVRPRGLAPHSREVHLRVVGDGIGLPLTRNLGVRPRGRPRADVPEGSVRRAVVRYLLQPRRPGRLRTLDLDLAHVRRGAVRRALEPRPAPVAESVPVGVLGSALPAVGHGRTSADTKCSEISTGRTFMVSSVRGHSLQSSFEHPVPSITMIGIKRYQSNP